MASATIKKIKHRIQKGRAAKRKSDAIRRERLLAREKEATGVIADDADQKRVHQGHEPRMTWKERLILMDSDGFRTKVPSWREVFDKVAQMTPREILQQLESGQFATELKTLPGDTPLKVIISIRQLVGLANSSFGTAALLGTVMDRAEGRVKEIIEVTNPVKKVEFLAPGERPADEEETGSTSHDRKGAKGS
jgi:hypothetical protein